LKKVNNVNKNLLLVYSNLFVKLTDNKKFVKINKKFKICISNRSKKTLNYKLNLLSLYKKNKFIVSSAAKGFSNNQKLQLLLKKNVFSLLDLNKKLQLILRKQHKYLLGNNMHRIVKSFNQEEYLYNLYRRNLLKTNSQFLKRSKIFYLNTKFAFLKRIKLQNLFYHTKNSVVLSLKKKFHKRSTYNLY
jgi:hypothetical protein